jgi:exosortase
MRLSGRHWAGILLVAVALALVYGRVFVRLAGDWIIDGNYSHGFLIVPIAAYFVWERRAKLAATPLRPSWLGLGLLLFGFAVLLAGLWGSELFLSRFSIIPMLAGIVLFLWGWGHLRILSFPIAFLFLMIPIPAIIFNQIAFPLQLLASQAGEWAMTTAGIPVLREGNVLILAHTTLEVAEACSGIRSLVSLITLGFVYGYFIDSRTWVRALIVVSAVPVAILANAARVAGTGMAAQWIGPEAAEGFFHDFSGWIVFIFAFAMMLVLQRIITWIAPKRTGTVIAGAEDAGAKDAGAAQDAGAARDAGAAIDAGAAPDASAGSK